MHNVILFERANELVFELIKEVMKIKRRLNYYYEFDDDDEDNQYQLAAHDGTRHNTMQLTINLLSTLYYQNPSI